MHSSSGEHVRVLVLIGAATSGAAAQPLVAPTNERLGLPRGEDWGGYNVLNSFELGYRAYSPGGNLDRYRSDVNLRNGFGLLAGNLRINSRNGRGKWLDELVLTTQGMNSDPYRFASLRVERNGLYRYEMTYRQNDYFNPGLVTGGASGLHALDTEFRLQDHNLTLWPQSRVKFLLGYSRGTRSGPGISTIQLFDPRGDIFPLIAGIRSQTNEYRVGNEIELPGVKLVWTRAWEYFREDTPHDSLLSSGVDPGDLSTISEFQSRWPYRGKNPYWRVGLFSSRNRFSMNARFTYRAGRGAFMMDERAAGTDTFGVGAVRETLASGDARRPTLTGNLNWKLTVRPGLSVSNSSSVYSMRIDGNASLLQQADGLDLTNLAFHYLGIQTVSNTTELNWQARRELGIGIGYQYANRLIRSVELYDTAAFADEMRTNQRNKRHAGTLTLWLQPAAGLTLTLNGELGRDSRPIYPISDGRYREIGGRLQYRRKQLTIGVASQAKYNDGPAALSVFSSRARNQSVDISWAALRWLTLETSYAKLHLNTVGGLAYFANSTLVQGQSLFFSNVHSANVDAHLHPGGRADIYLGYSRTQDTGDGRGAQTQGFSAAQTFPMRYQTPRLRLSVPFLKRMRWNIGYQYYGYAEKFYSRLGYRAHTGYSSLSWYF